MTQNLNEISKMNVIFINNEKAIADKKIEIEIWERDINQKKRIIMDIAVEIEKFYELIEKEKEKL